MGRKWLSPAGWRVAFTAAAHKFHVALVATVGVAIPLVVDGDVSEKDIIAIVVAFVGALGVFAVKNEPPQP